MRATAILRAEHEAILSGTSLLQNVVERIATDEPVSPDQLGHLLGFFDAVADGTHRAKEEKVLFPALAAFGFDVERAAIAANVAEHVRLRSLLDVMRETAAFIGGSRAARGRFVQAARSYVGVIENHIAKENSVLFPMIDEVLAGRDESWIVEQFAERDAELGAGAASRMISELGSEAAEIGR
jgi:hemerythrin-like domain-containing protein